MITINVKGIEWEMTKFNGHLHFKHKNMYIFWNGKVYQAVGVTNDKHDIVNEHVSSAECVKLTSKLISDTYANRLIPALTA